MNNLFSSINHKLLITSFVLLVLGYFLLGRGPLHNPVSLTVAPLLIIGVYCVLIPVALLVKEENKSPKK
ncbi:MAG TPA: hypothetical protein VHP36_10025 [Chitinispirillaceae bacterium]|nr:hypothetical protein [Chitinispirillaceae bacterium]